MLQSLDHWMFFTYFTNLSNIFIDLCLLIFLIYDLKKTKYISQGMYLIKFMGTISITLTFFVYLLLLAPTNSHGFIGAYLNNGAGSLCVHFITPVLAIIDFTGWFGFDLSLLGSKTLGIGTFYMIVVLLIIFIGLGKLFLKIKKTKKDFY